MYTTAGSFTWYNTFLSLVIQTNGNLAHAGLPAMFRFDLLVNQYFLFLSQA